MKAWKLGAEEPSTPQWTFTDTSSLSPGTLAVGAWHWGGETPPGIVDAVFDDLYFTPIPEPAGAALLILGSVGIATVARRRQNAAMFRHLGNAIACGSAILLLACSAQSGEIKIVSPNAWADVEAEGGPAGAAPDGRFQHVYPSADFGNLPLGNRRLTGIAYRPDGSQSQPVNVTFGDVLIRLSTTSKAVGGSSTAYDENWGTDLTTVLAGPVTYSSANSGPEGGPKDFDILLGFQTPFVYNPEKGNLLIDVVWHDQSAGPHTYDFIVDAQPTVTEFIWSYTDDLMSSFQAGGYPTQFTFIPEPATALLSSAWGASCARCRRRQRGSMDQ